MAHVEKFKAAAIAPMLHHYTRDNERTLSRENIDRERTRENYRIGPERGRDYIDGRVREIERDQGRAVRSDAVRMCDWVVTAPPDLKREDMRRFFESCHRFFEDRYGERNMLGSYVHMDETTPHVHVAFMPIKERDGHERLTAKEVLSREDMRRIHPELSRRVESDIGYRVGITLDDGKTLEKALSRIDGMDAYQRERDRLERLRQREREAEQRNRELRCRAERMQREVERARGRERELEQTREGREEKAKALSRERGEARGRVQGLDERARGLRGEIDELRSRIDELGRKVRRLAERARGLARDVADARSPGRGLELAREIIRGRGGHREQARAMERERENSDFDGSLTRGRGQERGQERARDYEIERER